jgi:hypothetical protein
LLSYWKNSKIIKSIRINYLNIYVLKSYKKYKLNYIKWLIYVIKKKIVNKVIIKSNIYLYKYKYKYKYK